MIFARIVFSAILVGTLTGILLTCLQVANLNPIIFAAESYEVEASHSHTETDGDNAGHSHDSAAWTPADGLERTAYSLLANLLAATGFAAILMSLMCLFCLERGRPVTWTQGALWGLAGYGALYLAPAIGLPPEIPGGAAAAIGSRQLWWILTAFSVALAFSLFAFVRAKLKPVGLLFLILPYAIGPPRIDGPVFSQPDASAVEALGELHQQFIAISAINNLVFWLILGLACRFLFNIWLRKISADADSSDS